MNKAYHVDNAHDPDADQQFLCGGYARQNYVRAHTWRRYYIEMEGLANRFSQLAWADGPHGYKWPLDPFHWWSRTWEYPWIAAQIDRLNSRIVGRRALDIGAAVTFFTYYLEAREFEVTNLDCDAAMPTHFARVFSRIRPELHSGDLPRYVTEDARKMRFPAGSFDLITCVSVLEHIPSWEIAVEEICRVLAPGGTVILTFDIRRNRSSCGLDPEESSRLLSMLRARLTPCTIEETAAPVDALDALNAPLRSRQDSRPLASRPWSRRLLPLSTLPVKAIRHACSLLPREPENLWIYGGVWQKRMPNDRKSPEPACSHCG